MADPVNTAVLDPYKSDGLRPASIIASIDLSRQILVNGSVFSASFGWALKNVASNLSMVFNFPVPLIAPSSSVTRAITTKSNTSRITARATNHSNTYIPSSCIDRHAVGFVEQHFFQLVHVVAFGKRSSNTRYHDLFFVSGHRF